MSVNTTETFAINFGGSNFPPATTGGMEVVLTGLSILTVVILY